MNQNVKDILRTGDICEIRKVFGEVFDVGETFAICIEGRLYECYSNDSIWEVENFEGKIVRILRPTKMEKALDMWRYANEDTWKYYAKEVSNKDAFKTVYIKDKPTGLTFKILRKDLSYADERLIECVRSIFEFNPTLNIRLLYELLNSSIGCLLSIDKYGIACYRECICITRMSDHEYIAEISENNHESE